MSDTRERMAALALLAKWALEGIEKHAPHAAVDVVGPSPKYPDLPDVPMLAAGGDGDLQAVINRLRERADADRRRTFAAPSVARRVTA